MPLVAADRLSSFLGTKENREMTVNKQIVRLMKEAIKQEAAAQKDSKKEYREEVAERRKNGGPQVYRPYWIIAAKDSLRHFYAAYAIARGKDMEYVNCHVDRESKRLGRHKVGALSAIKIKQITDRFEKEAQANTDAAVAKAPEKADAPGPG
jgi:hypothetical protein